MYFHRSLEALLSSTLNHFPACLITGPRQSGKSTLLQHLLKKHSYITFDDPIMRSLAKEDPALFLRTHPEPLILDEIQYVPELLPHLKLRIDADRRKMGRFVLTGSQTFSLMTGISETLAGRLALFHLYPLHWAEIEKIPGKEKTALNELEMADQLIRGFYPEFFVDPELSVYRWHSSYLSTYIERDVRNIKAITDLALFQTFLQLLAARAGKLLNLSEIAKECAISQPTAKAWLTLLESSYIIYLLRPYHANTTKRYIKSPKLYFVDTGLLCYLLGIDTPERFFKTADRGALFENMVIMDLIKSRSAKEQRTQFSFLRTASDHEIDLILQTQNTLTPCEIKLSKSPSKAMTKAIEYFQKEYPQAKGLLLSLYETPLPLAENLTALHWRQALKQLDC